VSRSGYNTWKKDRKKREVVRQAYIERVRSVFREGKGTYGTERICGILRKRGYKASFFKVQDIIEKEGLRSITKDAVDSAP
jgi:hypothetical protein